MKSFDYLIESEVDGSLARAGVIKTPHGDIKTPAFIAVGTKATVKALTPEQIEGFGAKAILVNAYHLYLQPGPDIIDNAGGISKFMNWDKPTLSDSGGFQVLSLGTGYKKVLAMDSSHKLDRVVAKKGKRLAWVDNDGVIFKSHIDGSKHRFNPEISMQIQHKIGADIIFAFDECTSIMQPYLYQKESLERTHLWAKRCVKEHARLTKIRKGKPYQALYGVIQGANYQDLREEAAKYMSKLPFDGYGLGGAFEKKELGTILSWVNNILPKEKPKHLLGLSEPDDIFIGIENGADTFDCVAPARMARNGSLYTSKGRINIKKSIYANNYSGVIDGCECYTCANFSKAYINHLFRSKERLAATLSTIHNEYFIVSLVNQIRQSIIQDKFKFFKNQWLKKYYN